MPDAPSDKSDLSGTTRGEVPLYDALGDSYDVMVDWTERLEREAPFFDRLFGAEPHPEAPAAALRGVGGQSDATPGAPDPTVRRVLDVGCGTGGHTVHFARRGLTAVGADPSAEMIRVARRRASDLASAEFVRAGLGELRGAVSGEFDAAVCLGNTLPHVAGSTALRAVLADLRATLRPGGLFVAQLLNYDRILAQRIRFLGVTGRDTPSGETLFFRFYDFPSDLPAEHSPARSPGSPTEAAGSGFGASAKDKAPPGRDAAEKQLTGGGESGGGELRLTFNLVRLGRGKGGEWSYQVDSTSLLPLRASQLQAALGEAGFGAVQLLGAYDGRPFDPVSSSDLMIVARVPS